MTYHNAQIYGRDTMTITSEGLVLDEANMDVGALEEELQT